jgi:hypothetical protein
VSDLRDGLDEYDEMENEAIEAETRVIEEGGAERPGHQHLGEPWGPCRECGQPVYHEVHTKWAFAEEGGDREAT